MTRATYRHARWNGNKLSLARGSVDGVMVGSIALCVLYPLAVLGTLAGIAAGLSLNVPLGVVTAVFTVGITLSIPVTIVAATAVGLWWVRGSTLHLATHHARFGRHTEDPVDRVVLRRVGQRLQLVIAGASEIVLVDAIPRAGDWTWYDLQCLGWEVSQVLQVHFDLQVDQASELAAHHALLEADLARAMDVRRELLPAEHAVAPREPTCLTWDHHGATSVYGSFDAEHLILGTKRFALVDVLQVEAQFHRDFDGRRVGGLWIRTIAGWGMGPEAKVPDEAACADLHGLVEVLRDRVRTARRPQQLGHAGDVPDALRGLRQRATATR